MIRRDFLQRQGQDMSSGFSSRQVFFFFKMAITITLLLATASLTVTAQQYDVGIDFRGTQNYVTDPAYAVFDNCVNDGITPQTRTNSNGQSVTWQWSQKCNAAADQSTSIDPRLAGVANTYTASGGDLQHRVRDRKCNRNPMWCGKVSKLHLQGRQKWNAALYRQSQQSRNWAFHRRCEQ